MADKVLKTVIQVRRDTAANWELNKATVPAAGEPCFETDTGILKMGDGVTAYESLPAIGAEAVTHGQSGLPSLPAITTPIRPARK